MGGVTFMTTNFQISNYYPKRRGCVLNLFNGCVGSSASAALLLYILFGFFGYSVTWLIYCPMSVYILARTVFLMPVKKVPYERVFIKNRYL